MREHPELYAIAKKITLEAGYPYTDPRTLETTQPMNKIKKPAWVLYEELHVEVYINTRMSAKDRARLRKALNSKTLKDGLIKMVLVTGPVPPTDKPQIKVKITR
jgi:hypothetical protein